MQFIQRHKTLSALGAVVTVAVLATGCASSSAHLLASSPSSSPSQAYTPDTSDPLASASPSDSPTDDTTGAVGDTFKVTDSSGNVYDVTLIKIVNPAQGTDEFNTPDNGKHFVGAVFTLTGESGSSSDDANNDAVLVGSDGQDYTTDFDTIQGYTDFNDGEWSVSSGQTVKGAVTFQVPNGVSVASVQWGGMFGSQPATWNN